MKNDKYVWHPSSTDYPKIDVHSIRKHEVLKEYLRIYVEIVGGYPYSSMLRLNLVDGFAGGGKYITSSGEIHDGSPLLMIDTIETAASVLSLQKKFKLHSRYYFVEKEPSSAAFLRDQIQEKYKSKLDNSIFVIQDTFQNRINEIISDIKKKGRAHRTIFFLDQYGYSEVSIKVLNKIFRELPKAEVILTFNVDSLIDYMSNTPACQSILDKLNLDFDLASLDEQKKQKRWRENIQFALYKDFKSKTKAGYMTNFFIKSSESTRSYWLLHLSMSPKAKDEMQKLHWQFKNHFVSETKTGLKVFPSYNPKYDIDFTRQSTMTFSSEDEVENKIKLLSEIPQNLSYTPIQAKEFFLKHINDTPATQEMIYNSISDLSRKKEIKLTTKNDNPKKNKDRINDDDLIFIPRQQIIHF